MDVVNLYVLFSRSVIRSISGHLSPLVRRGVHEMIPHGDSFALRWSLVAGLLAGGLAVQWNEEKDTTVSWRT